MKNYYLITFLILFTGSIHAQNNDLKLNVNKGSLQISSDDGQFSFGMGGRVYMDAAAYFDDETDLDQDLRLETFDC